MSQSSPSFPLGRGVVVLKRADSGLYAFNKPAGVLSHPNSKADEARALLTCTYDQEQQCYQWSEQGSVKRLWLLNRLDSATSGVIMLCDTLVLAEVIRESFRVKHVKKVYQALVFGTPSVPSQVWKDRLAVQKKGGVVRTSAIGNIPCECAMKLLGRKGGNQVFSLLRLEPKTGRSHQLRVQCAKRSLPIVGDATYGDFGANRIFIKGSGLKRMFLHALETSFEYNFKGITHRFSVSAPLPPEFLTVLGPK